MCPPGAISKTAAPVEPALPRGTALGRFVVLGLVGRGAMGEVYGAYDPELDRKIAIKLVRAGSGGVETSSESRARLMREAQATAKVSHPNVVIVHDAGTFQDRVFIAMEFVEGHTLRYWLELEARSWPEVIQVFTSAGRGLAAAHEKGLVHRDFKPDNVMVGGDGQVRVMDFGLARVATGPLPGPRLVPPQPTPAPAAPADEDLESTRKLGAGDLSSTATGGSRDQGAPHLTRTGAVMGTPAYMSPEQFRRAATDARSDQFSFCVALYEAVYRERPFGGGTLDELTDNVVAGRLREPREPTSVPAWLRGVLLRGLSVDPNARFPTMSALLAELDSTPAVAHRLDFASGAGAKLAGVWEAPVAGHPVDTALKAEIRQAFLATGKVYAAASFASASAVLDRYAQRWAELYVDVCEATHVRGEQSAEVLDLRMACLLEGLEDLKALCRLFRQATGGVVENAVSAANALGTLERCQDVKLLRAVVRPPEDAATRALVEVLGARLVQVRALHRVGQIGEALRAAESLEQEVRRAGYGPLLAETLLVLGAVRLDAAQIDAAAVATEEAVWTAELARHDEVAAEGAAALVFMLGYVGARFDVGEIWSRHAETLLRRMGGHDRLWGWLLNNRATMRELQGRVVEAVEDNRMAVASKERALGPDHPDVALSIGNLANNLVQLGQVEEALTRSRRAVALTEAHVGPQHPQMATMLTNLGEILCRLGRFAEGRSAAERALEIFERESDADGLWVTYPLLIIGLSHLGVGLFEEAVPVLERAARIRDAGEKAPVRLAEVHFALARALWAARGDRRRALDLAARARGEYQRGPTTPILAQELAALDRWLAGCA